FFQEQGFHEFITPILNASIPLEPNIFPFKTQWKSSQERINFYLPTSPEKNLKEMLALGTDNCFSIGHSFRNLEAAGPLHSPEFLMLEWYRKNADYEDIMDDTQKLLVSINQLIDTYSSKNWKRLSLERLFFFFFFIPFQKFVTNDKVIVEYAKAKGYETKKASWNQLYDQIFVNEIEPHLPKTPCFLIDFPSRISPLCKPKKNEPYLAERFELYINRIELANGNTENTDIQSVKKRLRRPLDHDFLGSLNKMKVASYAGVGLGVDRLTMLFLNVNSILFEIDTVLH
ncbi:hypothetical protein HY041_01130, partial [Candidatus Roizmanbacteria bacterium]|nr:hypothetical protein [Candidatus Roizmanbacteria bacterium]